MTDTASTIPALGRRFVEALASEDAEAVRAVLHPEIDFRALTPDRFWRPTTATRCSRSCSVCGSRPTTNSRNSFSAYADVFADREQIRLRFRGRNRDGAMLVEQQAYLAQRDSLIGWTRIVCSGERPCP